MTTEHTPGPWRPIFKFNKTATKFEHAETWLIMGCAKTAFRVSTVNGPSNRDSVDECKANAKLIAAAPDLLEACRRLINATNHPLLDENPRWHEIINNAKDAIKKATS